MPLYIVPTPIGNLGDITLRAVQVLKDADTIACEDTRRTLGLLNHLGISKRLISYHAHSTGGRSRQIFDGARKWLDGRSRSTDAGTPGLSDPGAELVKAALEVNVPVISLPGPCAAITALVGSGLPTDRFFFIGFLPRRPARARRALQEALTLGATLVIYESPYRTRDTVRLITETAGAEAPVVIAREMTKIHEEFLRGTAQNVLTQLEGRDVKGEVVILVGAIPS